MVIPKNSSNYKLIDHVVVSLYVEMKFISIKYNSLHDNGRVAGGASHVIETKTGTPAALSSPAL